MLDTCWMLGWTAVVGLVVFSLAEPAASIASVDAIVDRGDVQVLQVVDHAEGLPIHDTARWLVVDGEVVAGTPSRRTWSRAPAPQRNATEVLEAVTASGVWTEGASVHPMRRADDGSVLWSVRVRPDLRTLSRPVIWVDDVTLAVERGPDHTRYEQALAYPRNPVLDATPQLFALPSLELPITRLVDARFDVRNCGDPGAIAFCDLLPVEPTDAGDFVFDAPQTEADHVVEDDAFAAASIYVHADRFVEFAAAHDIPLPPCLENEAPGILLANYRGFDGERSILVANAGYTGDCGLVAFFGQGPHADWGYDADVVVHELTHGTIAAQMGPDRVLGKSRRRIDGVVDDAGAIGEAVADFVAAVMTGDPDHAEYVATYGGREGRSADNDLRCPNDLVGQIHADARPLEGALWEAYLEVGDDLVTPIIDAIALLSEDASFEDAAVAFEALTRAELGDTAAAAVREALERHNLIDCTRAVAASDFTGPLRLYPRYGARGRYDPMRPPSVQLSFEMPEDANTLSVDYAIAIIPEPGWSPVGDVHVLTQEGGPIDFAYTQDDEGVNFVDAAPQQHIASVNDGTFSVSATPGATVHVAFFNQGLHVVLISDIEASYAQIDVDEGASSTGGDDPAPIPGSTTGSGDEPHRPTALDDDGGCQVSESQSPAPVLLLLMFTLWARSRSCRKRR